MTWCYELERRLTMRNDTAPAPALDGPIAGQSLTAELGARPWQNPPKYTTVEQAASFYVPRLTSERQSGQILDLLEMGVPVDTLVDTIQLGGVMEGLHSVDVGMLVSPVLAEVVHQMAKSAGVEHTVLSTERGEEVPDDAEISIALRDADKMIMSDTEEDSMEMIEEPPMKEEPKGLMARRNTDGI